MVSCRRWGPAHGDQTPVTDVAMACLNGQRGPSCCSGPTPQRTAPCRTVPHRAIPCHPTPRGSLPGLRCRSGLRGGGADTSASHFSRQPARTSRKAPQHTPTAMLGRSAGGRLCPRGQGGGRSPGAGTPSPAPAEAGAAAALVLPTAAVGIRAGWDNMQRRYCLNLLL